MGFSGYAKLQSRRKKLTPITSSKTAQTFKAQTTEYVIFSSSLLFVFILLLPVFAHAKAIEDNQPLRIAVAANFSPVLQKLLPEFSAQTQINTEIVSAATGTLFQQLQHGAPFDIFLSADAKRPQWLSDKALTLPGSQQTYAIGQLVLWSSNDSFSDSFDNALKHSTDALSALTSDQTIDNTAANKADRSKLALNALINDVIETNARLAIANPKTAPYGVAAKETLISLGLWQNLRHKLITGANINQTFQQVRSKNVTLGLVANSQLRLNQLSGILIPQGYYSPLVQQLVIPKTSRYPENARILSKYLLSDKVQQQLSQWGYLPAHTQLEKAQLETSNAQ